MLKFFDVFRWLPTAGLPSESPHSRATFIDAPKRLPRKFEGLQAAMLMFCGAYGVAVDLLVLQAAWLPLIMSVSLFAFGALRWVEPARSKLQWALDALFAWIVLCAIFADASTGGSAGPYLFLAVLFAMTFPLLMDTGTAVIFGIALLAAYFGLGKNAVLQVPPAVFALRGVLIAGICMLSARFGHVLRQSESGVEQLRRDIESDAYNEHGWHHHGEIALKKAWLANKPFSLVYLSMPPDWTYQIIEAKGFVSPKPHLLRALRAQALQQIAQSLSMALPSDAIVGRDMQGDWVLLLPQVSRQDALLRLERRLGRPLQINFGAKSDETFVVLMPCVVEAGEKESLVDLHARAVDIWNRGVHTGAV